MATSFTYEYRESLNFPSCLPKDMRLQEERLLTNPTMPKMERVSLLNRVVAPSLYNKI
jgi:hypothetical protein